MAHTSTRCRMYLLVLSNFFLMLRSLTKLTLALVLLVFAASDLAAQIIYDKLFQLNVPSTSSTLTPTHDGYLLGGSFLLRVNQQGNEILQVPVLCSGVRSVPVDSGFVVAQSYNSSGSKFRSSIYRYDKDGNELWKKNFNAGHWSNFAEDILAFDDETFLYAGRFHSVTSTGAILKKLDANGSQLWEYKWNLGSGAVTFPKELYEQNASAFVTGVTNNSGNGSTRDLFTSKHQLSDGTMQWSYINQADSAQEATDVLLLDQNNLFVLGNTNEETTTNGSRGMLISLTSSPGSVTENWVKYYSSPIPETFTAIEAAPDSGYLILGYRGTEGVDSVRTFLMRVNDAGVPYWEYLFGNNNVTRKGLEMERESNSVYVIGGYDADDLGSRFYTMTKFDLTNINDTLVDGLNELSQAGNIQLSLYPNPTADLLQIHLLDQLPGTKAVQILDVNGRVVDQFSMRSQQLVYEVNGLQAGTYFLQLTANQERVVKTFVVR